MKRRLEKQAKLLQLLEQNEERLFTNPHNSNKEFTLADVARSLKVSVRTVHRWRAHPLREEELRSAAARCGRKPNLTAEEQQAVVEFINQAHHEGVAVTGKMVVAEIARLTNNRVTMSLSGVSQMLRRLNVVSKTAQTRPPSTFRPTFAAEVSETRLYLLSYLPHEVIVMDESGLFDSATVERSYVPAGRQAYLRTLATKARDTVICTLCGDGTKLPLFYVRHQRRRTERGNDQSLQVKVAGVTNEIFRTYIKAVIEPYRGRAKVLAMDRLSCHTTKENMDLIRELGLEVHLFPPKASVEVSPLDNTFFALYKRLFAEKPRSTPYLKFMAACQTYNDISADKIVAFFRHCSIVHPDARPTVDAPAGPLPFFFYSPTCTNLFPLRSTSLELSADEFDSWYYSPRALTVVQLRGELRAHGLRVSGRKAELISRLTDFFFSTNSLE